MNLVLCDDERIFVEALAAVFRHAGHCVTECVSVDGLVEALGAGAVDACMVDLFYGAVNGADAIRDVVARFPLTPLVIYTGCQDAEILQRLRRCGVAGVLSKSLDLQAVVLAVESEAVRAPSKLAPPLRGPARARWFPID